MKIEKSWALLTLTFVLAAIAFPIYRAHADGDSQFQFNITAAASGAPAANSIAEDGTKISFRGTGSFMPDDPEAVTARGSRETQHNKGNVTGSGSGPVSARFTTFDAPGAGTGPGQGTSAGSINEGGQVMGFYLDTNNVFHGFVRDRHGILISFDAPGAGTGAFQGTIPGIIPLKINEHGAIPGTYLDANNVYHGFVRDRHGFLISFDAPGAGTGAFQGTLAVSINDGGAWDFTLTRTS